MTPKTLNRNISKWPEVKICFILDLLLTKCIRVITYILVEVFIFKKMLF